MNPELPLIAAEAVTMGGAGIAIVAYQRLTAGRGAHRALPRGERVPAEVAEETVVPEAEYAGFHDGSLNPCFRPDAVAVDWGQCDECTSRRYGQELVDGSFYCPHCDHITPAGAR